LGVNSSPPNNASSRPPESRAIAKLRTRFNAPLKRSGLPTPGGRLTQTDISAQKGRSDDELKSGLIVHHKV